MKIFLPAVCLTVVMLCGCQSVLTGSKATPEPDNTSFQATSRVARQQQQLWLEGDMNTGTPVPVAEVRSDSDRLTLRWDGDAIELLRALAWARGEEFSYVGVRLPLPVNIDVQYVTYANLLRMIEMQTAWRAQLHRYPGQMVIEFMSAIPERRGGRR
ncbi:DotD/TraH family lipoprotein (plasmid) [Pantoea allii]|uniref:DotD/TraH family lipoprotein n=1 Tax=Pantoea allii TaxID=574096 RepID=UPI003977D4A0